MRKFLVTCLILILFSLSATAQPNPLWTQTFGGAEWDCGCSVQQTNDGGYIVAGHTDSWGAGGVDVLLIKTDARGNDVWQRTFGGGGIDEGHSVQQTSDGGYIVAGHTESYGAGSYDVYLIKTDADGDSLWTRTFGGSSLDQGFSVRQTSDGGYIITGYTYSLGAGICDVYLIKTDGEGNEEWQRTFGGINYDRGECVQQTSEGGYVVTGIYGTGWFYDVYLIKTDADGDSLWTKTFGGSYLAEDYGCSVQQTFDGGYIISGFTCSYGGQKLYLIKTDEDGNEEWFRAYGGGQSGNSVDQTSDGGYIIAGYTQGYSPNFYDLWLVRTDANGDSLWSKTLGGTGDEVGYSIQQTSEGGYITVGETTTYSLGESDVWLIRLEMEPISITLTPHNPPIQIPSGGGSFQFDIKIINIDTSASHVIDVWTDITLPGGVIYPIFLRENLTISAGDTILRESLTQFVPGTAMAGSYSYNAHVRDHETWQVLAWDSFPFEKLPGDGASLHNMGWALLGWDNQWVDFSSAPSGFELFPASPNPFNPETKLTFSLPMAGAVSLIVYDIQGRVVSLLVDGWRQAGTYEATFNATNFPSGVYFTRLQANGMSRTQKLLLIK